MGRNNSDFAAGLYHGSHNDIPVGDIIKGHDGEPGFATNDRNEAYQYGGNVYRVEPVDPTDVESWSPRREMGDYDDEDLEHWEQHPESETKYHASKKGFKVVEQVN